MSTSFYSRARPASPLTGNAPAAAVLRRMLRWGLVGLLLLSASVMAEVRLVSTQQDYRAALKQLRPGDELVLANGVWRDFEIRFEAQGTEAQPITLRAEEAGKVILSGRSRLALAGQHLIVRGLVFRDGHTPTSEVISFRVNADRLAQHSRVTETVIDHYNNPERFEVDFWVMMYGRHNRFDHNHLIGKRNKGVTMAVRLNSEASQNNEHRIDHNYFGPRPALGSNGGETLRIGTSHYAHTDSLTRVEHNVFDRCDGEVEIVSSKSGRNVFRGNTFIESRGTLTLRHGDGNLVENNVFIGNGVPQTGGIRVINRHQVIRNNYLEGLTGYRFGSALTIMNGVPDSPANRYVQVDNALIERNSIINSDHIEFAAGSDDERSAVPIRSRFQANLIVNQQGPDNITLHDRIDGIQFSDNLIHANTRPAIVEGFTHTTVDLKRASNGLLYPVGEAWANTGVSRELIMTTPEQTGVSWYPKPERRDPFTGGRRHSVDNQQGALARAVSEAGDGDVLVLKAGDYRVERILPIDKAITIEADASAGQAAEVSIRFERSTLFELHEGGSLTLRGLRLSGQEAPDQAGNSLIRTTRESMLGNYALIIEDCEITDLDINHSFDVLRVASHTFADRIVLNNTRIARVTGHVLRLDVENEDLGIYNAEQLRISDSRFEQIGGSVISLYRGGTDESTFGPQLTFETNTLKDVGMNARNRSRASLALHGVQIVQMQDNRFEHSAPVRITETVGEPRTHLSGNRFVDTEEPIIRNHRDRDPDCVASMDQAGGHDHSNEGRS